MLKTRNTLSFLLALLMMLSLASAAFAGENDQIDGDGEEPRALNVALYKSIPYYFTFEKTVETCWKEQHPEVKLNFVSWNSYSGEVPDDLDAFVFDAQSLDAFVRKGYLLSLSEEDIQDYDDLIPSAMEGCRADGKICAVPQMLCTDLLFTRKDDDSLKDVQNLEELYNALGDSGLLMDKGSPVSTVVVYLQALVDGTQLYTHEYPPIEEGALSTEAIESLEMLRDMHQVEDTPNGSGKFYYAQRFAEGMGEAYLGYSEAMDVMGENASEMDFRLISMTDDENIPLFYVDAAAINAKISDEKKALAIDFLNMITGKDLMVKASMNDGDPRYLLPARYSTYDALAQEYPIYVGLKEIATVPNACVFRIQPDGDAYIDEFAEKADLLPSLTK